MKARLNITIEESLLNHAKRFAFKNDTSVSQLVESYFKSLGPPAQKENIIQLVEKLQKPKRTLPKDLKKGYYEEKRGKHGF